MDVAAVTESIEQLTVTERITLVERIWDSIARSVDSEELPQSHKDELDRRLEALSAEPGAGSSWSEVKARLLPEAGEQA